MVALEEMEGAPPFWVALQMAAVPLLGTPDIFGYDRVTATVGKCPV